MVESPNKYNLLLSRLNVSRLLLKIKGKLYKYVRYVLSGWPTKMYHLNYLKQKFLSPHMIFVFDLDSQAC